MQKVVGSNPISRFGEGLHLQVFFVRAVVRFSGALRESGLAEIE
jgi:hypothetical protein